ncbi:3-hydroxyacyl-CoA dehydrogenase family protein [Brevibacillus ginsengisoli]|uniref:3-hydroxyacyl-CoA dehydrogenase family protein n=1 Tax=Brevibacillus ginsengisoli TaxID=363854 RepID=UPI003CF7BCBF
MSIKKVGLIIDGTRDCWIAEALAEREIDVLIYDQSRNNTATILSPIETILDQKLSKWGITQSEKKVILSHIKLVNDLESLHGVDFLIESVGNEIEAKKDLINQLDRICPKELIIASNTCIFCASKIAEDVAHPDRVIGLHFQEELVEIIPGERTSEFTLKKTKDFVESIGKTGISATNDNGLISMRLILPLMNEAFTILQEGRATAEEIDQTMKKGFGFKFGPIETADRLGLHHVLLAMEQMYELTKDARFRPSPWLVSRAKACNLADKRMNSDKEEIHS